MSNLPTGPLVALTSELHQEAITTLCPLVSTGCARLARARLLPKGPDLVIAELQTKGLAKFRPLERAFGMYVWQSICNNCAFQRLPVRLCDEGYEPVTISMCLGELVVGVLQNGLNVSAIRIS